MAYVKGQPFKPQFIDPNTGLMLSAGTIEFYVGDTTTPTPYYTDSTGTVGGTSLELDAGGKPPTDIFFDTDVIYKLVVKNGAGTPVETLYPYSLKTNLNTIDNYAATVATIPDIRTGDFSGVQSIQTLGYATAGDGGAGLYYADTDDAVTADDGFLCIVSADGIRFKLDANGVFKVKQAGQLGSGDDLATINNCIAAAEAYAVANRYTVIDFGEHEYTASDQITISGIKGAIHGNFKITADHSSDWILKLDGCNNVRQEGLIWLQGGGSTTFSTRTNMTGLIVSNSSKVHFEHVMVYYTIADAIRLTGTTSQPSIDYIETAYCGSASQGASIAAPSTSLSSQVQNGSANSASQRSVLTLAAVPQTLKDYFDASLDTSSVRAAYLQIGGRCHWIESYSGSTVTVWPWVDTASVGSAVEFLFGAGVFATGGDTSVAGISYHTATGCGVAYAGYSLYPASYGSLVTQNCGIALGIGYSTSSASVGFNADRVYFESNELDIVQGTQANCPISIAQTTALSLSKCQRLYSATSAGVRQSEHLGQINIGLDDGRAYTDATRYHQVGTSRNLNIWEPEDFYIQGNTVDFQIVDDAEYLTLFGRKARKVIWYGHANGLTPTGSITFTPPSGATLNGAAADTAQVYNTASGPQEFLVAREDANTWYVEAMAAATITKV